MGVLHKRARTWRSISGLGRAPTNLSTSFPSLKKSRVGILCVEYCAAVIGFSSTFSFAILTRVAYSEASCSRMGETIRQGPHHGAQQSTTTAPGNERTSSLNVPSVTGTGRLKNPLVTRDARHLAHTGFSRNRFLGIRFFVPQLGHGIIMLS